MTDFMADDCTYITKTRSQAGNLGTYLPTFTDEPSGLRRLLSTCHNNLPMLIFSSQVNWPTALALAMDGIGDAFAGNWLVHRLPGKLLRGFVVLVGI